MQPTDIALHQHAVELTPLVALVPLLQEEQSSAGAATSGSRHVSGGAQQPSGAKSKAKRLRQKAAKGAT